MKVLVISDVHSNIISLEAILEREQDHDLLLFAGDLLDFGPFPSQVLNRIMELGAICVMGNHDQAVLSIYDQLEAEPEVMPVGPYTWKSYNAVQLSATQANFLREMPERVTMEIDGVEYLIQHRYMDNYRTIHCLHEFNAFWNEHAKSNSTERRMIFGHTHRQGIYIMGNDAMWLNPGSISYRRDDDPEREAQYITIVDQKIELKTVDYDRSPLLRAAEQIELVENHQTWARRKWN